MMLTKSHEEIHKHPVWLLLSVLLCSMINAWTEINSLYSTMWEEQSRGFFLSSLRSAHAQCVLFLSWKIPHLDVLNTQKDRLSSPSMLWQTRYTCAHTHMYKHVQTYTQTHIKVNKSALPASRDYIGLTFRKISSWEKERKIQQHAHTHAHTSTSLLTALPITYFPPPHLNPVYSLKGIRLHLPFQIWLK